VLNDGLDGI